MSMLKNLMDSILSQGEGPQGQGAAPSAGQQNLVNSIMGMIGGGGLNGLLDSFRQKGLGEAVQSWIGTGSNTPISGQDVQASLGEQKIAEIAQSAGLSKEETAGGLAQLLPQLVDKLSPDGKLPDGAGLAGLLQSFLGGRQS